MQQGSVGREDGQAAGRQMERKVREILEICDGKEMALAENMSWDSEDLGSVFALVCSPSITVGEANSIFLSFSCSWCLRGSSLSVHNSQ